MGKTLLLKMKIFSKQLALKGEFALAYVGYSCNQQAYILKNIPTKND